MLREDKLRNGGSAGGVGSLFGRSCRGGFSISFSSSLLLQKRIDGSEMVVMRVPNIMRILLVKSTYEYLQLMKSPIATRQLLEVFVLEK